MALLILTQGLNAVTHKMAHLAVQENYQDFCIQIGIHPSKVHT